MAYNTILSGIEILMPAMFAVAIVVVALSDDTRRSRMAFATVLALHAVAMFGGLLVWRFTGLDGTFPIVMTHVGGYCVHIVGPVAVTGFILLACANLPSRPSWKARRTASAKRVLPQWLALFLLPVVSGIVGLRYGTVMLMYPATAFSSMILFMLRCQNGEEWRIRAAHELAEGRVKPFTEQLHPHFIFNSLTAIQELCMEDPDRARKAIQELSVYLRGNIDAAGETTLVPIRKEIRHVKAYLDLLQADAPRNITVSWNIRTLDFRIPPLSMQPLVEHVIKFHPPCTVDPALAIKVWQDDAADYVSVHDDAESECPEGADHRTASLDRVAERLGAICNGSLAYDADHGTTLTITIPKGGNA